MLISINERRILNVNVYIEKKTEFKILVYFITFPTPGKKSVYTEKTISKIYLIFV